MKKSHMGLLVIAAVSMGFISVQNVSAETISGTIDNISERPNIVTVGDTDVYSVPLKYLAKHDGIVLEQGMSVSFEVSEFTCPGDPDVRYRFEDIN